jgi:hypothetical protein
MRFESIRLIESFRVFPLFWFIGCFMLLTPLRAPEDWERTKVLKNEWS